MSVELSYFDRVRGKGEVAKLLLVAEVGFDNVKWTGYTDFSFKANPKCLLGQLPIATVDGVDMVQSKAIERAIARKYKRDGDTEKEKIMVDMICETVEDLAMAIYKLAIAERFAKDRTTFLNTTLPGHLKSLETLLNHAATELNLTGKGFAIGQKLTLADVVVFEYLTRSIELAQLYAPGKDILEGFPRLAALKRAVESNSNIKSYMDSSDRSKYFHGPYANFFAAPLKLPANAPPHVKKMVRDMLFWKRFRGCTLPEVVAPISFITGAALSFVGMVAYGHYLVVRNNRE